jgi:hypothetical protein
MVGINAKRMEIKIKVAQTNTTIESLKRTVDEMKTDVINL